MVIFLEIEKEISYLCWVDFLKGINDSGFLVKFLLIWIVVGVILMSIIE